jgi:hypothetical protein
MLIGDAYTTSITAGLLTYLRKPYKLDFNYTELVSTAFDNLLISAIPTGSYFLAKTPGTYFNSTGGLLTVKPGDKVLKVAGYHYFIYDNTQLKVGYPWGTTDTPDFPDYLHDSLVDLAVSLFLDEAKFKLIPKSA